MKSGNTKEIYIVEALPKYSHFIRVAKSTFSHMNTLSGICSLNTFPANTHHSSMYETAKKKKKNTNHASFVKTEPKLHSFNSDFTLCLPNSLIAGHLIKRSCANLSDTINPISNMHSSLYIFTMTKESYTIH